MPAPDNFRSAFNGFHREDVVRYIEHLNNGHSALVNQLNATMDALKAQLSDAQNRTPETVENPLNEELQTRCIALEAELAALREENRRILAEKAALLEEKNSLTVQLAEAKNSASTAMQQQELEAYRRAERLERIARERAGQVYHQANGALADAAVKLDEAFTQLGTLTDQVNAHLQQLQTAVDGSKQALADASATLYAIRPDNQE